MRAGFFLTAALALCAGPLHAFAPERSPRPEARDTATRDATPATRGPEIVARAAHAGLDMRAPAVSTRPLVRPATLDPSKALDVLQGQARLDAWLGAFRGRARAAGIGSRTIDTALSELRYRPEVIGRDRTQAEFTRPLWTYLERAVTETRVDTGRAALADRRALLDGIEARYRVDRAVLLAVWGMETNYGAFRGDTPILDAMATLAVDGRRARFFEAQLIAALRILEDGHTTPGAMRGSWAGAMGHTQFMPTSFLDLSVDFTGDGRRDIWGEDPADALASTANFLRERGWVQGQPWGVEVRLPDGFDYGKADRGAERLPSDWARLGVRDVTGAPVPDYGPAGLWLPAGHAGPAFLTFDNFGVIKRYNPADAYVLAVGHLSDRIAGAGPLATDWPDQDRALSRDERRELQSRLTALGFDTKGVDGRIGPASRAALRAFQAAQGLVPDAYASPDLLERLRRM